MPSTHTLKRTSRILKFRDHCDGDAGKEYNVRSGHRSHMIHCCPACPERFATDAEYKSHYAAAHARRA